MAAIDLGGIFGDENEADEDEPDEGGKEAGDPAAEEETAGVSRPVLLLLVAGFGLIAFAAVVGLLRRSRPRRRLHL